jgi:Putative metallopeptidase/Helix-turn-helix domain
MTALCKNFVMLPLALLIGAAPLHAQNAPPEQQRVRARMENAIHEMGGDARMKKMSEQQQQDLIEFVAGNMLFVGFHEMGHALVSQLRLPVLGRGEDAADSFATLAMLQEGTEFSVNVLVQAARGWFLMDRREQKLGNMLSFYDEHGLDKQRAYAIVCLMVGSNDKLFKELADWVQMPEERQQTCHNDYDDAKYSWDVVLKPFLRSTDQPKSNIDIVYEPGPGKLDAYARSFRSIGFLETLAEHTSRRYVLPRPIGMVMKGCGDSNAWWNTPTLKETLCYEMAEDFVELYQGYTEKRTVPQRKMQSNELIAQNVRRIRLQHNMSMASVAIDSGLPEAWVSRMERGMENCTVDQLEKLARALKVETATFFVQPSNKQAAVETKPRSRK